MCDPSKMRPRHSSDAARPVQTRARRRKGVRCSSMQELKVLITREQIATRVAEMGRQITADSVGEPVNFVGVLKGAAIFLADLIRMVGLEATFEFIGVSSYCSRPGAEAEQRLTWDSTGE